MIGWYAQKIVIIIVILTLIVAGLYILLRCSNILINGIPAIYYTLDEIIYVNNPNNTTNNKYKLKQ